MKHKLRFRNVFLCGALFFLFDLYRLPLLLPQVKTDFQPYVAEQVRLHENDTKPYTQQDILRLYQYHPNEKTSVLIFDGWEFKMYRFYIGNGGFLCRDRFTLLLVEGLRRSRPERFVNNSQPFQMAIAGCHEFMDYTYYPCSLDNETGCSNHSFAPLMTVASAPKSPLVTFIHQFPSPPFGTCLHMWLCDRSECDIRRDLKQFMSTDETWEILKPQLYYRGADFRLFWQKEGFDHLRYCGEVLPPDITNMTIGEVADILLQEPLLQPRCRAVAMSLRAEWLVSQNKSFENENQTKYYSNSWFDARFRLGGGMDLPHTTSQAKLLETDAVPMSEIAKYKYQIDFGGIGGTTWTGTITKLAMPGVLFHHETPAKDWFHDEIQPWVHYVPVDLFLSNLYDMYVWAETHPIEAKKIAKQGQEFARYVASGEYWNKTFEKLYVQGLGRIVDAYQPSPDETLSSILEGYLDGGFNMTLMGALERK
ncbi:Glycosyl transferase family 90 [Fragilaria crotonensis]|nr:Glycosyl transferase family 90 [Fragilaria crotonensis]